MSNVADLSRQAEPFSVVNGYQFVDISTDRLPLLRDQIETMMQPYVVKGTILLSEEGVNVALCATKEDMITILQVFKSIDELSDIVFKVMANVTSIFRRLIVKIKPQIIVFEDTDIDPRDKNNQRMQPIELKRLLDEGADIVLLDTRNEFEVDFGTFKQAKRLPVDHFRSFCRVIDDADIDKGKTIVTFCTGGIRCEKVVPHMRKKGYKNVYQLEGGIFNYFKEVGGAHWDGECFVFDYRMALDSDLKATDTVQCRCCYGPVNLEQQEDFRYVDGLSCPHCYQEREKSA